MTGYSGAEIYDRMVEQASGTESLSAAQRSSHKLMVGHDGMATDLEDAQTEITTLWKGKSAETAVDALTPLITASKKASEGMDAARWSMWDQMSLFHETQGKLEKMPHDRPDAGGIWDTLYPFGATDTEEDAARWDDANANNIQQYKAYKGGTQQLKDQLHTDYEAVDPMANGSSPDMQGMDPIGSAGGSASYYGGGYSGGIPGPTTGPGSYTPSSASGGVATPGSAIPAAQSPVQPSYQAPPVQQSPAAQYDSQWSQYNSQWSQQDDTGTATASYLPSTPPGGFDGSNFGPRGSSFGPTGSHSSGGYSGSGYSGSGYAAGGYGGRGYSAGAPSTGSTPGAGRTTGTAPYSSSSSAASRVSYASTASSSSSYGRPPMMAGGAGQGQGGEDEEHEWKVTLPGEDPNSIFGGIPDDVTVVPPVIGE